MSETITDYSNTNNNKESLLNSSQLACQKLRFLVNSLRFLRTKMIISNVADNHYAAYQTALLGLSLTVLCLVGASSSRSSLGDDDDSSVDADAANASTRIFQLLYHRTARFVWTAFRQVTFPARFLLLGASWQEDGEESDDEIDMTVINHTGCCQCESVMFQVNAPRTLKEEVPPAWLEDDEDDGTNPKKINNFPKTLIPFNDLGILQGSEHLRNYQKPSAAARKRQQQYQHPLALVAIPKDVFENKNMIKTFCGRCGTHLFWKSPHDVTRHVYINLDCLQSDWIPMPVSDTVARQSKALVARSPRPLPRKKKPKSAKKSMHSASKTPKSSRNRSSRQPPPPVVTEDFVASIVSAFPEPQQAPSQSSIAERSDHVGSLSRPNPVTPPKSYRSRSNSLIRDCSGLSDDDRSLADLKGIDRPTDASETASTITYSSASVGVWRLRDPRNPTPSSSHSVGTSTWEERLTDEISQEGLLYQMRRHLKNHKTAVAEEASSTTTATMTTSSSVPDNSVSALNSTGEGPRVFLPADTL